MKLRLLFLNPGGDGQGGAERSLTELISGLSDRGHECHVLVFQAGDAVQAFSRAGARSAEVVDIDLAGAARHGSARMFVKGGVASAPRALDAASAIRTASRRLAVDVVHSNGFRTHLLTPLLGTAAKVKVWSLRDRAPAASQRALLRMAAPFASAIACNSRFTGAQLGGARSSVRVVGNPVSLGPLPDPSTARSRLGLDPIRPVVAVVAHLHPSKGHHVAVAALEGWPQEQRPQLAIAGGCLYGEASKSYEARLRGLIGQRGLERDVVMLGAVESIEDVYAAADVILHPALYPEGFGRSVVEAQLAGKPVVATDLGGVAEMLSDGVDGLLVPPGDKAAITEALSSLFDDAPLRARLVLRGLQSAARFSPEKHVDAIERLYECLYTA